MPNQITPWLKVKFRLFLLALMIIISVLAMTGLISSNVFEQKYTESTLFPKIVKGQKLVGNIEYSLKYGKHLNNYLGMEEVLATWQEQQQPQGGAGGLAIQDVRIVMPYQQISYGEGSGTLLPRELSLENKFTSDRVSGKSYSHVLFADQHHIFIPIFDGNNNWAGSLNFAFSAAELDRDIQEFIQVLKDYLIILIGFIIGVLAIYIFLFNQADSQGRLNRKRIITTFILILGLAQFTFGYINYSLLKNAYHDIAIQTAKEVSQTITDDLHQVMAKGITYDKFYHVDSYMEGILRVAPLIKGFKINQQIFSLSPEDLSPHSFNQQELLFAVVLAPDSQGQTMELTTLISTDYINEGLKSILIEMGTILVLAFFIMVEVVLFAGVYLSRSLSRDSETTQNTSSLVIDEEEQGKDSALVIRMMAFTVAIVVYISASFVPNVMNQLYTPIPGVPTELVLGLPISIVFFSGAIFAILGGGWIDRFGWQKLLYVSLACILISSALCGMVESAFMFVMARGLLGVGYSLTFISLRSFAVSFTNAAQREVALAGMNSGLYSGINAGVVLGAMAMEKTSYQLVFYLGAAIMVIPLLINLFVLSKEKLAPKVTAAVSNGNHKPSSGLKIFKSREVLIFIGLMSAPMAMTVLFVDFFVPTYAISAEISISDVGRAFLLNGIFVAYVSPLLLRFFVNFQYKTNLIIASLIAVLGFLSFALTDNLIGIFIAVSLLGISDGLVNVFEANYYLKLKSVQLIGQGQALGYLETMRKLAQSMGPQVFALGLTLGAVRGMSIIIIATMVIVVLFAFLGSKDEASLGKDSNTKDDNKSLGT